MECTQCQLCTRLTDRLCCDNPDNFTLLNHTACSQVTSVTLSTNTFLGFTGKYRTDFHTFDRRILDQLSSVFANFFTGSNNQFTSQRMLDIMNRYTSQDTFIQRSDNFFVILQFRTNQTTKRTTVFFIDDNVMRYVYQTTSQVTSIGSLQRGIGQTFTSTVGRDEVLQH